MKAYPSIESTVTLNPIPAASGPSRLANLGRLLLAAMCVSLVSFAAAPQASAAAPNGTYTFKSASGSVNYGDKEIDIPTSLVKKIANVVDKEITIKNRTLKVSKNASAKIVTSLTDEYGIDVDISVTGPNTVTLSKVGDKWSGSTTEPIVASFEGTFKGDTYSGELVTEVDATVKGKTLTIVITFSGYADDEDISGRIVVVAKR